MFDLALQFILHLQCLKHTSVPVSPKQPYILCYLSKPADSLDPILLRHQIMVDPNCPLGGKGVTYDWLDGEWRKAVKDQIDRLNVHDPDMTRHPWALHRLFKVIHPGKQNVIEGITMVLQWQEVEPVPVSSMIEVPVTSATAYVSQERAVGSRLTSEKGVIPHFLPLLYCVLRHTAPRTGERLSGVSKGYAHVFHVPCQRGRRAVRDTF